MDFKEYLLKSVKKTDLQVNLILKQWREEAGKINKNLLPLIDAFINSNKGGKGIRGVLVRLGYEIASSKFKVQSLKLENREIYKIAAAYEILHTSILAHDDIMDQDLQRRGQPSLYQALSHLKDGRVVGNHYGISQAISLADAGFFLSTKVIADSKFEEGLKNQALSLFAKIMVDTAVGQMLDVNLGQSGKGKGKSDEDTINTINLLKTARYTISGPLKLGAILGGGNKKLLDLLDLFGENLGIAYQIRDDILDSEVQSVDKAKIKVLEYTDQARSLIPKLTKNMKYRKLLLDLTEYLVERRK